MTKRCRGCLEDKPIGDFWVNRKNNDNLQARCKECSKTMVYKYRTTAHGMVRVARSRFKHALSHHRLTEADYDAMLFKQDGLCAICEQPERVPGRAGRAMRRLAVDHCHKTGKIRGLLCAHCNQAIGKFLDSPALLRRAAVYLETSS